MFSILRGGYTQNQFQTSHVNRKIPFEIQEFSVEIQKRSILNSINRKFSFENRKF